MFPGDKEGFPEVSDCEVTGEVTSHPEKVRMPGPISPADLIQLLDSCPLPDLVKHTIKTLIEPYTSSPIHSRSAADAAEVDKGIAYTAGEVFSSSAKIRSWPNWDPALEWQPSALPLVSLP